MLKKVRLLVVDDQAEFCDLVQEIVDVSRHIFDITCQITSSGEKAMELMKSWEPSVVLLDAHLSDSNCFEILEDCKHSSATIVVTSTEMSHEIEEAARKGGASGYVCKSNNLEDVERLVHDVATMAATDGQIH